MKHDFQDNEEDANTRLREEAQSTLYNVLKVVKEGAGVLTNIDIARGIVEALGEDAGNVAGAIIVLASDKKAKFVKGRGII